jgi:hypothetical protein
VQDNPRLSPLVRVFAAVVVLVLVAGTSLLVYPALMVPRWPWPLAPFTARFLGAFYLAEMVAIVMMGLINRWAPARLVLIMAVSFTLIVSLVCLWHIDRFNFGRWGPWGWFFVYVGSAIVAAAFVWTYRRHPHPGRRLTSAALRSFFVVQALVVGGYGLTLLATPEFAVGFWPWRVDRFHAQVYSAIFITAGLGAYLLSRSASASELAAFGFAQVVLGSCAILGVWLANATAQTINWTAPGAMLWVAFFAAFALAGAVSATLSVCRWGKEGA